jgi:hypothetical protein
MKIAAMLNKDFQDSLIAVGQQRIDMVTAMKLKKIVKAINEEISNYNSILDDIKKRNTNEKGVVDQNGFQKEYVDLVNLEVDTGTIHIDKLANTTVSVKDLELLAPILEGLE